MLFLYSLVVSLSWAAYLLAQAGRGRGCEPLRSSRHLLVEELFGLVDLCREVRAASAVGVVEQHERPMRLADLFLAERALTVVQPLALQRPVSSGMPLRRARAPRVRCVCEA